MESGQTFPDVSSRFHRGSIGISLSTLGMPEGVFLALAEVGAREFGRWRVRREWCEQPGAAITGLRWLWRHGNPAQRAALAVRVRIWGRAEVEVPHNNGAYALRILERETERVPIPSGFHREKAKEKY